MDLPTINLPAPVTIPAIAEQTVHAAFATNLQIQPSMTPGAPWPYTSTLTGIADTLDDSVDPVTGISVKHTLSVTHTIARDLSKDILDFPAVAAAVAGGGSSGVLTVLPSIHAIDPIEKQIVAGLADIKAKANPLATSIAKLAALNTQLAKQQDTVALWSTAEAGKPASNGGTYTAPDIARHLASAQAAVAVTQAAITSETTTQSAANSAFSDAINQVWVTLLGQWRTTATPLGVTDVHALPRVLQGVAVPPGITI